MIKPRRVRSSVMPPRIHFAAMSLGFAALHLAPAFADDLPRISEFSRYPGGPQTMIVQKGTTPKPQLGAQQSNSLSISGPQVKDPMAPAEGKAIEQSGAPSPSWKLGETVKIMPDLKRSDKTASHASSICTRMKATDTLIFHGQRQHAERFVECVVGHWPNVHSVFRGGTRRQDMIRPRRVAPASGDDQCVIEPSGDIRPNQKCGGA